MARRILSTRSMSFISTSLLWPESRPFIAQDFAKMCGPHKCIAQFSFIYRSIFIALVRLIMVTFCLAHQRDFLWLESRRCLAQNFRTGKIQRNGGARGSSHMVILFNPLRPKSDLKDIYHCNVKGLSVREIMRIENLISEVKFC